MEKRQHTSHIAGYWEAFRHGHAPSPLLREIKTAVADRDLLLQTARQRVADLPDTVRGFLPDRTYYDRYQPTRSMFLNKMQLADDSPHNLAHMAATEILAGVIGTTILAENPESGLKVSEAVAGGAVHDTQRLNNNLETVLAIRFHGWFASLRDSLYREVEEARRPAVKNYVHYHDAKPKRMPEELKTDPTFATLQLADALGMVRFVTGKHKSSGVQAVSEQALEYKLVEFQTGSEYFQGKVEQFWPIAAALYIRGEEIGQELKTQLEKELKGATRHEQRSDLRRKLHSRDYQYEGMIRAGQELGIIKAA